MWLYRCIMKVTSERSAHYCLMISVRNANWALRYISTNTIERNELAVFNFQDDYLCFEKNERKMLLVK